MFLRLLSTVLFVGFGTVLWAEDVAPAEDAATKTAPAVTIVAAETAEVQARVPTSGSLVAWREVQVHPQVSGYEITEILVEAGDTVEKGQVLARLSTDTLTAQLEQAEAEYARAEAGVDQARSTIDSTQALLTQAVSALERAQRLRQGGTASQSTLDDAIAAEANARGQAASATGGLSVAQAALGQAVAARRIARLNLDRAEIIAPVGGFISARTAELGGLSGVATEPLFTIIEDSRVEFAGDVIETALPALQVGAPATIRVAGLGEVTGKVRLVPAAVDPVTRLGFVRIELDQKPGLRAGLFGYGWVTTAVRDAVTVPVAAVLSDGDGDRVQVVKDGVIETRPVDAGLIWEGRREIVEGLAEGEDIVARAGAFFRSGDHVRRAEAVAADEPAEQAAEQ